MSEIMNYPKGLAELMGVIAKLPTIGEHTALKISLNLYQWEQEQLDIFAEKISELKKTTRSCQQCGLLCEQEYCLICLDETRDQKLICVVENISQVYNIEKTKTYHGQYHILGKSLDLLNQVVEEDLNLISLWKRLEKGNVEEVIIATGFNLAGETTAAFLREKLQDFSFIKQTRIASGIPMGMDISHSDPLSLSIALQQRQ